MPLFNRKTPQHVMGRAGQPEAPSAPPAATPEQPPRPREMRADNRPQEGNTLMEDMSPKRQQGGAPAPQQQGAPASAGETFVSGDTVIEGTIHAKSELRIDGTFKGEVKSNSRVIVGTAGKLEATVEAKSLVVSGRVVGNLKVHERLELLSTGEIFGDLQTQPGALIIEKGSRLEGRCTMGLDEKEEKPAPAPQKSEPSVTPQQSVSGEQTRSGGGGNPQKK